MRVLAGHKNPKYDWGYFAGEISTAIEHLAIDRHSAVSYGVPQEKVDEYITTEAQRLFAKFDGMNDLGVAMYLLGKAVSEGKVEELAEIMEEKDDPKGEKNE